MTARPRTLEEDEARLLLYLLEMYERHGPESRLYEELHKKLRLTSQRRQRVLVSLDARGLVRAETWTKEISEMRGTPGHAIAITGKGLEEARRLKSERRNYMGRYHAWCDCTRLGSFVSLLKEALFVAVAVIAVLLAIRSCDQKRATPTETRQARERATRFAVLGVIDGNTFTVMYDREETSVRIAAMDAPELREPGGPEAKAALEALIGGKVVTLRFAGPRKRDALGRLLAEVFLDVLDVGGAMKQRLGSRQTTPPKAAPKR